ncbi:MAG TPA: bifunctional UDP-sugar hydrolase/5'-nucleotidase [Symbiobacteriaceae bacterium]|nr:bifunctional UDP-sugar hydrolase/5'-nucleotidase [Symbiobacteriaceae bacterium]
MKKLLALVATLTLLVSLIGAGTVQANNRPAEINLCAAELPAPYAALAVETERNTDKPQSQTYDFTVKADAAQLVIENGGIPNLDVTINGQRFNLNPFFEQGEGSLCIDISGLISYGRNTLEVQALGQPNQSAKLTVHAPAFAARILHTNDIHAAIDPLPKMAAYVKSAKAAGSNIFFVDAGDNFSGNPVSDLNQGLPMIEALNGMSVDVAVMGNHDFDHGPAVTQSNRELSHFPWISANTVVTDPSATPIQPYEPYKIFTNDLGQKIAFVGLTQTPPATGTKNQVGLRFDDPLAAAQQAIEALRDQVNLIVLISHNGHDWDSANAAALQGAHLIIGAHSHTNLAKPAVVAGIPIFQVGSGAAYLGDLVLTQTDTVALTPGAAGNAYKVTVAGLTEEDPNVKATITAWKDLMAPVLGTKIGTNARALPNDGAKTASDIGLGNLIADALKDHLQAEIGLWNNGGIRADLPAGDITMNSVYKVLPFGNIPWKVELTGAQLIEFFTRSFNKYKNIDMQVAGLTETVFTKPDGTMDHIDLRIGGQPIGLDQTYTVAMSDYVATSPTYFAEVPPVLEMASVVDAIAVAEYIKKLGTVDYALTEGRIKMKASPAPVAVSTVNFYSTASLLAAGEGDTLVPLTDQADVLVWAESTAYQSDMNATAPKNFMYVDYAGAELQMPLAALEKVGGGKVVGLGAILVSNGYKTNYQHAQWFTNLLDYLGGSKSGTVLVDIGHGQYYSASRLSQIKTFLGDRGWTLTFTATNTRLTADRLAGVKILWITTPGSFAAYNADELAILADWVAAGGSLILGTQSDYGGNSVPTEMNRIAGAAGSVIRFNSDQVTDDEHRDPQGSYSPVTDEFSTAYPELLKAR